MPSGPLSTDSLRYLDFHTHRQRHADRAEVMEIISLNFGENKPHQYYTVGRHPWWTDASLSSDQTEALAAALQAPHCLAMGEMGLDKLKGPPINLQMDLLREQLHIAAKLALPVIIHCVRAYGQLLQIKKEFPHIEKWCVHGFGRHATLARQLTDQGFYLSIMPTVPAQKYHDFFDQLPVERLFLETDSMAGFTIEQVYHHAAAASSLNLSDLCQQMKNNAKDFFNHE